MAFSLKLTDTNDIELLSGRSVFVRENDNIIQNLRSRLNIRLGELYFNTRVGLDFENILSVSQRSVEDTRIIEEINAVTSQSRDIINTSNFSITRNMVERSINVRFDFTVSSGETLTEEVVIQ